MIGFDFGARRIGVAIAELSAGIARPLATVANREQPDWQHIDRLIKEWLPTALIVGMPQHEDGGEHRMEKPINAFCAELESRYALKVQTINEAYSSGEARAQLKDRRLDGRQARIKRGDTDPVAAMLLLESFMNEMPKC